MYFHNCCTSFYPFTVTVLMLSYLPLHEVILQSYLPSHEIISQSYLPYIIEFIKNNQGDDLNLVCTTVKFDQSMVPPFLYFVLLKCPIMFVCAHFLYLLNDTWWFLILCMILFKSFYVVHKCYFPHFYI